MEELIDQVDKLSEMIKYIDSKTNNNEDETANIISTLGLDDPHVSRTRSIEEYKKLVDKLIRFREIVK